MASRVRGRMSSVRPCFVYVYDLEGAICDCGDVAVFARMVLYSGQEGEATPAK
jgi:hypothetical protein